jgi:hypothetical protein
MTSEPLPAECAEVQRRVADDYSSQDVLDHLARCVDCSAFAAALLELDARLVQLPQPEPPAGAVDRAIVRFRAEFAAHAAPSAASLAEPLAPATPAPTPLPSSGSAPSSGTPPERSPRTGQARMRQWRRLASLAAGLVAATALVVALVAVLGPASTPLTYPAILHEAAVHTGAEKSARFDITGDIGLSVRGQSLMAVVTGTGSSESPDRGELTEVATLHGRPLLRQDIVRVGDRVWTRMGGGPWMLVPIPPDHASPIDQALAYPAQALDDLSRVGSGYRSLGTTTVGGTGVRQLQLTIPGDSFHAFGNLPEKASNWTVVVDVSKTSLILRRLTITGRGVVSELGTQAPFTYHLALTLHDFGAGVSIQPPDNSVSAQCGRCRPGSSGTSPTTAPATPARTPAGSSPSSTPFPSTGSSSGAPPSSSPSPRPSSSAPPPSPTPTGSEQPSPSPTSSCSPSADSAGASPAVPHKPCTAPASPAT